jgi:hypothetical protein
MQLEEWQIKRIRIALSWEGVAPKGFKPALQLPDGRKLAFTTPEAEEEFVVEYLTKKPDDVIWRHWLPNEDNE